MFPSLPPTQRDLAAAIFALFAVTFAVDVALPPNVAGAVAHLVPILLTLRIPRPRAAIVAAGLATVLTVLGVLVRPDALSDWNVIADRFLALFAIWVTAAGIDYQKRTSARLERARADREQVLSLAPALYVALDPEGRVRLVNPWGQALLGIASDGLVGQGWVDRFVPEAARAHARERQAAVLRGEIEPEQLDERPVLTSTDEERWIAWHDAVLRDAVTGAVTGMFSAGVDITERRKVERKLADQRALAQLGEMAAVVAHEVKNPLSGIASAIQVIEGRFDEASRERKVLADVRARIASLDAEVTEMLAFARPREPQLHPVDLREICDEVAMAVSTSPAFSALQVRVVGRHESHVNGDPDQLRAALFNLALNGAQACDGKGPLELLVREQDEEVVVEVRDFGPGMDEDTQARAFEPFFTTRTRGTGLGLPIVKRTIEAHGGSITIDSGAGTGTTVSMHLPVGHRTDEPAAAR